MKRLSFAAALMVLLALAPMTFAGLWRILRGAKSFN